MALLKGYILPRFLQWFVVIVVGITITFLIPRLLPSDPVEKTLSRLASFQAMEPRAVQAFKETLQDLYGLRGTLLEQYLRYWGRLLRGDLGPSLNAFPTPVSQLILTALPWTVGLLTTTIVISWFLGLVLGTFAGYFPQRAFSKVIDKVLISVYPVPYYILGMILVIVFAYCIPFAYFFGPKPDWALSGGKST
jgi:peptide/nickel transport system permease protein